MREDKIALMESQMQRQGESYAKKYRSQMKLLESSLFAKSKRGIDPYDQYALGKQLEQWEMYQKFCEEQGNTNQLGTLPKIALDVITVVAGTSIIPAIASVQPIEEERGVVYFKQIRAQDVKGNMAAKDIVVDPRVNLKSPQGYASMKKVGEAAGTTGANPGTGYQVQLAAVPIRSESLIITVEGSTVYCQDVGPDAAADHLVGKLLGVGLSGTVNYTTGLVTLTFAVAPAANKAIYAEYQQNAELASDLPQLYSYFDSKVISAYVYALKGTLGMFKSFAMQKRFGLVAEDELARDLSAGVNLELGGDLIRRSVAYAQGNVTFYKKPPTGVSYFEHKQTFKDTLAAAEATMLGNAGRGTISVLIAGRELAAVIQTLPGFEKLSDGATLGAHIFGTLDGITIIRVNEQAILDSKVGTAIWKGPTPFEAALVYAPYMPLAVTSTIPLSPNPLATQRAAAVWAGVDTLIPNFITKITLDVGQEP